MSENVFYFMTLWQILAFIDSRNLKNLCCHSGAFKFSIISMISTFIIQIMLLRTTWNSLTDDIWIKRDCALNINPPMMHLVVNIIPVVLNSVRREWLFLLNTFGLSIFFYMSLWQFLYIAEYVFWICCKNCRLDYFYEQKNAHFYSAFGHACRSSTNFNAI